MASWRRRSSLYFSRDSMRLLRLKIWFVWLSGRLREYDCFGGFGCVLDKVVSSLIWISRSAFSCSSLKILSFNSPLVFHSVFRYFRIFLNVYSYFKTLLYLPSWLISLTSSLIPMTSFSNLLRSNSELCSKVFTSCNCSCLNHQNHLQSSTYNFSVTWFCCNFLAS